ncbi:hypothetical protein BH23ACT2_BH23ACT2_00520 [soil metagenome]
MDVNSGPGNAGEPDDRDLDEGGLDLTPRRPDTGSRRSTGRRWGAVGALVLLAGSLVFIAVQARGASLFFLNADEAVAQQGELGDSSFRLQGQVSGTPVRGEGNEPTRFTVTYNDIDVDVRHTGSEPALFKEGLPVVAEGRWSADGATFESTRLLVKHTEDYTSQDDGDYDEENPERIEADVDRADGGAG